MGSVFKSVLRRYNYDIQTEKSSITFNKVEFHKSPVKIFYTASIILVVIGIITVFKLSFYLGLILLFSAIPMYLKGTKLNDKENKETSESIVIGDEKIIIQNSQEVIELNIDEIKELNFDIEKDRDISIGTVGILMEDNEVYILIKIFGGDKRYVEDDIEIIANNMTSILNE